MPDSLSTSWPVRELGCPPPASIEQLASGEVSGDALAAHVSGCASCQAELAKLQEEQRAFLAARPKELFVAQVERRAARSRRGPAKMLAVAMAGAGALAVLLIAQQRPVENRVSFKGALASIHVQRAGTEHALGAGEALHPKDALRFVIHAERAGYAAVFERDAQGTVAVVAPYNAKNPQAIAPGSTALPDSAVLDAVPGTESFFSVYSPEPFDIAAITTQLAAGTAIDCRPCTVELSRFEKQP